MNSGLRFLPRAEIDRGVWNAFVDANDQAWFWHRSEFIDARSLWPGCADVSFCVTDARGALQAVLPLYLISVFDDAHNRHVKLKWLYSEGGPAIKGAQQSNLRRKVMAAIELRLPELIEEHGAQFLEARVPALAPFLHGPGAPRVNPLFHLGFENFSGATWMVDVTPPPEEIRRRYSETSRQLLKKADRSSFTLRKAAGGSDLEIYYKLHLETISRLNSKPEPFEFFQRIFEHMLPQNFARIMFFEQDGQVIAANNTAFYKRGAYYWTSASRTEKHDYEGRVLLDDQIIYACKSGCIQFEAGKAYVNGDAALVRGLSTFKRSFGSEMVTSHSGRIFALEKKGQPLGLKPQSSGLRRLLSGIRSYKRFVGG